MPETTPPKAALHSLDILMVQPNPKDAEACVRELKRSGFDARADLVQTSHEFCSLLASKQYHVIIAADTLPGWNGLEVLELLQQMEKATPFILISGTSMKETAADCLKKGVADYVNRDRLERLPVSVQRALEAKALREERTSVENKLRESETRYQRLVELSPDPLFIESGGKLVFVNRPAAKLFGADHPDQLVGKPAISLVHPDSRNSVNERLAKLRANAEVIYFDQRLLRLDGKAVDVKVAAALLTYQDKPAVQFIARDVSERRRVEEVIKSLAAFPQLNPNPVFEFSRDGKLTYFNEAAAEMAKSLGHDHPSAILPSDTVSLVQMCLTSGQKKLGLETALGNRTLSWGFFPIKQTHVVHCYASDITERLSLEAQLRHSQKLESLGRLAAGVAHDFNNILTVIQGHAGLLRSDPNLSPEMGESLQQVSRAAERASKLTGQLLTLSRRNVIRPRRIDLNDMLTSMSSMLQRTLGEDITFEFNYAPDLPAILADASMIEQVVMNLAVNARDAMPRGGQLVISTAVLDLDPAYTARHPEARTGRFVCLSLTDNGCGMDQATLGRLFEPFFTTKQFGKGSGLGLATVYGIVRRHQGWIEVQSQVGQGSTFRILLPPHDRVSERLAEIPSEASINRRGSETILVVEDEPPVLWTVRNILERHGYRVLEAASGVEALAVWHQRQKDIALLLTDMVMPVGLSGQELAEKFKAQKPDLKVIYTSGYSVEVAGKGLSLMEGISFLEKPFDATKLARAVRECLDA